MDSPQRSSQVSMNNSEEQDQMSAQTKWNLLGSTCPRQEVVFFAQIICIYIVIIACIVNLSLKIGESNMWVALLSSCLGYILPSPSLNKNERSILRKSSK